MTMDDDRDPDYDDIDVLIDTDPIKLGARCRRAERTALDLADAVYSEIDMADLQNYTRVDALASAIRVEAAGRRS